MGVFEALLCPACAFFVAGYVLGSFPKPHELKKKLLCNITMSAVEASISTPTYGTFSHGQSHVCINQPCGTFYNS